MRPTWDDDPWRLVINSWAVGVILSLIAILAILCWTVPARGSWGPAGCSAVSGASRVVQQQQSLPAGWFWSATYPGWAFRTANKVWDGPIDLWWEAHTGKTVVHQPKVDRPAETKPAIPSPTQAEVKEEREINYGLDRERTNGSPAGYYDGTKPVSREEAISKVTSVPFEDDSGRPRVTCIGSEEQCKRVEDDIATNPALAGLKAKVIVKTFRPDDWFAKESGVTALPQWKGFVLLFSRPDKDGQRVDHAQWVYEGPAKLAVAAAAWDPTKTPDLGNPPALSDGKAVQDWISKNPLVVLLLVGGAIYWYKNRKV